MYDRLHKAATLHWSCGVQGTGAAAELVGIAAKKALAAAEAEKVMDANDKAAVSVATGTNTTLAPTQSTRSTLCEHYSDFVPILAIRLLTH